MYPVTILPVTLLPGTLFSVLDTAIMATVNRFDLFISPPPDNLKCVICLEVAKTPKQCEDCGKLLCSECIKRYGRKPCPNCRKENPNYFTDKRGEPTNIANEAEIECNVCVYVCRRERDKGARCEMF